ncbi:ALPHA-GALACTOSIDASE [Salix purpurea]|uniref:ALPHA-GALACTOSIDASE n=1 Tax=Salix purpurea TaxID=77065 RepID=A0A9Q0P367_SALPP|nr:ALPHA-GALACTOSIDASE [Salix purpurea]
MFFSSLLFAVKHDCVFGNDLDVDEITFVSEVLQKLNRPILYSVSPGVIPTPVMEKDISGLVNMYRVTGDDWDTWGDVAAHFDVSSSSTSGTLLLLIRLVPRACWGGRGLTWICCP